MTNDGGRPAGRPPAGQGTRFSRIVARFLPKSLTVPVSVPITPVWMGLLSGPESACQTISDATRDDVDPGKHQLGFECELAVGRGLGQPDGLLGVGTSARLHRCVHLPMRAPGQGFSSEPLALGRYRFPVQLGEGLVEDPEAHLDWLRVPRRDRGQRREVLCCVERTAYLEVAFACEPGSELVVVVPLDRRRRCAEFAVQLGLLQERKVIGHVVDRPAVEVVGFLPARHPGGGTRPG